MNAPYDLSLDAHVFVGPPFGKPTVYDGRETYGVLRTVLDLVDTEDGVAERYVTTIQVLRGSLGDVRLDSHLTHYGTRYRVLSYRPEDTGWFELFQVVEAGR